MLCHAIILYYAAVVKSWVCADATRTGTVWCGKVS